MQVKHQHESEKLQANIYKKLTPFQKWHEVEKMWIFSVELKRAAIQSAHPNWSDLKVNQAIRSIFLYATT